MQKTVVIILGAGAAIPWGGPTCAQITQELFQGKEYLTKNNTNLAEYIRDCLAIYHKRENRNEIHFEHIINALESISDFLTDELNAGNPPQFTGTKPVWLNLNENYLEMDNFRFEPISDGKGTLYNLNGSTDTPEQINENNHKRYYFSSAIKYYLNIIKNCISRYDYKDEIKKRSDINSKFIEFYNSLKDKGYAVRVYTTNYDELIPTILQQDGKQLYSGFDEQHKSGFFANINRILNDSESDCYYNLHGSIYWRIDSNDKYEPGFLYSPGYKESNPQTHGEYTAYGERTMIYNVLTGFNKLQKVSMEPLRSFVTRLSMDAVNAELLISIGYSYSDIHLNKSLAYSSNEHSKLLHITYYDNFFGTGEYMNMQNCVLKRKSHHDFIKKYFWLESDDKKNFIYTKGFADFLINNEWENLSSTL